jgi:hypothetical protein
VVQQPPLWARVSSLTRFLDHTQWCTTVGRTPLDEWSAHRRDLYLTTHNTHNRQTSMPPTPHGIQTHNLSMRAAADLRLRPCGHWDRHNYIIKGHITILSLFNLYCYMFWHFRITIRQFTANDLLTYTSSSNCSCWKYSLYNGYVSPSFLYKFLDCSCWNYKQVYKTIKMLKYCCFYNKIEQNLLNFTISCNRCVCVCGCIYNLQ